MPSASTKRASPSGPHRFALKALLLTNGLVLLSGAMLGPIYALFVQDIGGDILDTGLAAGIFTATAGIVVFFSGRWSDRVRESELVVASGYAIMGTGFFFYTQIETMLALLCVQALIGFGEAVYSPSFDALYSKHLDPRHSGSQWGTWESMNYFALATGAFVGSAIATLFGFTALFVFMGCLAFASALYILFLPRRAL